MAKENNKMKLFMIIGAIILLFAVISWVLGMRTIGDFIGFLAVAIPVLLIIGLLIYGIWKIFIQKPRYDNIYMNKKKVIETAKLSRPPLLKKLRLSGDREHSGVVLGNITGYTNELDTDGNLMDVITFKKRKMPVLSWFEEDKAVYVYPRDRSQLAGDVTIYSLNLKQIGSMYFPINYTWMDKMDEKIKEDVYRTFNFTLMSDLKEISDKSRGLDAEHQRELERKELFKMPLPAPSKSTEGY